MAYGGIGALVMDATQTVHTSGVNVASVVTLVCSITAAVSILLGAFIRWQNKTITNAIDRFSDKLEARLVPKDVTDRMSDELSRMKNDLASLRGEVRGRH